MDKLRSGESHYEKKLRKQRTIEKTEQELFIDKMMEDFDKADLDGDGSMDFSEYVRKVWGEMEGDGEEVPISLRQLRREFRKVDLNNDGRISRREFRHMAEKCFLAASKD